MSTRLGAVSPVTDAIAMPPFLFVYGTLMRSAATAYGRSQRQRLHAAATWLGPATVVGRLYDLGAYPGLIASTRASDLVHGELLRLDDAEAVLPWLDAYEGIVPGAPDNEYRRVETPARLAGGECVTAWVYQCLRDMSRVPPVADGRWLPLD